jgi:hypothetical protein
MRVQALLISLFLGMATCASAVAQVSIGIGLPGVSIGINVPVYPDFVQVPGYPVYYSPEVDANFFFYDGLFWVYGQDRWYASRWYNGPWDMIEPNVVPLYVLRVPVRYYARPPQYFGGWSREAPPRWGDHWGRDWERQHGGWDHWNRASIPTPAPLPTYQRQYPRDRYPSTDQQLQLHQQNYHYQPHEQVVRQGWYQQQTGHAALAQRSAPERPQNAPREAAATQRPAQIQQQSRTPQSSAAQHPAPDHQQDSPREAAPAEHAAATQQASRSPQTAPAQRPAPVHQQNEPRETAPTQHPAPTQQQSRSPQTAPAQHPAPEQQEGPRTAQSGQATDRHPPQSPPEQPQSERGAESVHGQSGGEDRGKDKQEPH